MSAQSWLGAQWVGGVCADNGVGSVGTAEVGLLEDG